MQTPFEQLHPEQELEILKTLEARFEKNKLRHPSVEWKSVLEKLMAEPQKIWSLYQMEQTGGEPDLIGGEQSNGEYHFYDCAAESPKGRRSYCFDREALDARKEHKPEHNVLDAAKELGIELLSEEQYRYLQQFGEFDLKTSSWIKTPQAIRKLGGALFGDRRYDQVFVYHNGAQSYYAARGFRGILHI